MKPNHHPNSALLMAYASGSLTEAFSLVVASHLSFCQECQQKVNDAEIDRKSTRLNSITQ